MPESAHNTLSERAENHNLSNRGLKSLCLPCDFSLCIEFCRGAIRGFLFQEVNMFVSEIKSADMKRELTMKIMRSLPEWFSPPEDIPKKAELHSSMTFFAVYDDVPIGFAALKIHNPYTAEIFNIGVLREYHRCGAGHMQKPARSAAAMRGGAFLP